MSARYPISVRKVLEEYRFFVEEAIVEPGSFAGPVPVDGSFVKREEWRFFSGEHRVGDPNEKFDLLAHEVARIFREQFDVEPEKDSLGYVWTNHVDAARALRLVYLALEANRRKR